MKTIFGKAADLIRENGWTTGTPQNEDGCLCAGGAIAMAITGDPDDMHSEEKPAKLDEALHKFGDHINFPRTWYDDLDEVAVPYDSEERVFNWNDQLKWDSTVEDPKAVVLKTLDELDKLEAAK
ncbi:DUF6197 family protein [Micromonospora sp. CB01531]|uniref:DUF6197 family protein n=1 Tax=Micromonospora sp. CB01531 TaxID=1718947 RepID=UPI00093DC85C|nr:hypothetical protein [Micromonospora sp. CB01531]OKI54567.1 hypothetical protein A6A27_32080 [Micromonospora sp. CB01531]